MAISHQFEGSIIANLKYWLNKSEVIPMEDQGNILLSVEYGLVLHQGFPLAIELAVRNYSLVEKKRNFLDWIRVLEKQNFSRFEEFPGEISKAQVLLGLLLWNVRDCEKTIQYLTSAYHYSVQHGLEKEKADACYGLCLNYWTLKQYEKSRMFGLEAVKIYRSFNNCARPHALTLNALGMVFHSMKDCSQAEIYFEKAKVVAKKIDDKLMLGRVFNNLATIKEQTGELSESLELYNKALMYLNPFEDISGLCKLEISRGLLHYRLGNWENAQIALKRAIPPDWEDDISPYYRAWVSLVQGYLYLIEGNKTDSLLCFELSVSYYQQAGDEKMLAYTEAGILETQK